MAVAVKDMGGEVALDGPLAESGFEGEEGGEGCVYGNGRHRDMDGIRGSGAVICGIIVSHAED